MNIGTIIVLVIVLAAVGGIIYSLVKNKKKGKGSCGCGCSHCEMDGMCHKK